MKKIFHRCYVSWVNCKVAECELQTCTGSWNERLIPSRWIAKSNKIQNVHDTWCYKEDIILYKGSYYFICHCFIFLMIWTLIQKLVRPLRQERTLRSQDEIQSSLITFFSKCLVKTITAVWSKYILQKFMRFFQRKYSTCCVKIQKHLPCVL